MKTQNDNTFDAKDMEISEQIEIISKLLEKIEYLQVIQAHPDCLEALLVIVKLLKKEVRQNDILERDDDEL
jgi:hypothetical protein